MAFVPVAQAENPSVIQNYDANIEAFSKIADDLKIELIEGEEKRDVIAFALSNITKNNLVPISIHADIATKVLGVEFEAFLQIWCFMPVVPKTEEQKAALRKVRKVLERGAYNIGVATLIAEDLAVTTNPAVYGPYFEKVASELKDRPSTDLWFTSLVSATQESNKWADAGHIPPGFYENIRDNMLKGTLSVDSLIKIDLLDKLEPK
jgi:hypothetical protein